MKLALSLLSALLLFTSCIAPPESFDGVTLYFAPAMKYVDEPRFSFTDQERRYALQEYRTDGSNTLFEFVIDSQGKVKKSRVVKTSVKREYRDTLENHARGMVFSKDSESDRYRAFYYRVDYDFNANFEWQ